MNENKREDELGALWRKRSNDGKPDYFTGSVQVGNIKVDIVVFENQYRKADNHPEFRILRSKPKPEREPSTRRDEQRRDPRPPSRHETLGVRPQDQPRRQVITDEDSFDSDAIPQTWASRPKAKAKPKPVNGASQPDWTDDVPHPVGDDDIPF